MRQGAKWAVVVLSALVAVSTNAMAAPPKGAPQKEAPAKAEPAASAPAPAEDETSRRVRELYATANKLFDENKLSEAEAAYQAAWDLRPSYDIAGNLGSVEMQIGQFRDAAEHITYALDEFPAGGKPEAREALTKLLADARKEVASVKIVSNIGGAKLSVDGRAVGQAPLEKNVFVDAGKRVFEARLDGFEDGLQAIDVQKGGTHEVSFTLVPKGGAGGGGGKGKSMPLIIAGGGLALVGIGVGVGLLVGESSKASDAEKIISDAQLVKGDCPGTNAADASACTKLKENLKDQDLFHNVGIGALVAGGVIGVGTLVYALIPQKKRAAIAMPFVAPIATPSFAGVSLSGRF